MRHLKTFFRPVTVISLLLGVIWLSVAGAATIPTFKSLGQVKTAGMEIPRAIDLDAAGNLYVADVESGAVFKFDKYNNFVRSYALGANGLGLAVTADGSTMFVSRMGGEVAIVDVSSGALQGKLFGSVANGAEFGSACEIDLSVDGLYVYVADAVNSVVKVYLASGSYVGQFGGYGVGFRNSSTGVLTSVPAGKFAHISAITVAPSGQIVVADGNPNNYSVHVVDLGANFTSSAVAYSNLDTTVFGSELAVPRGIAFDDKGRAYFLDNATARIMVVDVSGAVYKKLSVYAKPGKQVGNLYDVKDAAYDTANDRLYVSCGNGRVEIFGIDNGSNPQVVNHAPSAPAPYFPVGSEVASLAPSLEFYNATDEDGDDLTYEITIYQGGSAIHSMTSAGSNGETTALFLDKKLSENAAYEWTVQASDGDKLSARSAYAKFVVNATEEAPTAPVLISPLAGEFMDASGELSWNSSTDPDPNDSDLSYLVRVASDDQFGDVVATATLNGTSMLLENFADYGAFVDGVSYFWDVAAVGSDGLSSARSEMGQFVFDTTSLTVSANVPGATVSLYGNHAFAGQTLAKPAPLRVQGVMPGTISVVVERAGFEPYVVSVSIAQGDSIDLYAELVPAMAVDKLSASRNGINGRSGLSVNSDATPFLVDFDNDGDLDLLAGSEIFKNLQSAGRNRLYFDAPVGLGVSGLAPFVADWNNDGRKDLIIGQTDGSVALYLNVGSEEAPAFNSLSESELVPADGVLDVPAVLNYDNDGAKDLVVANGNADIVVYLNQGSDAAPVLDKMTPLNIKGTSVMPVDWDADGQTDLLVGNNGVLTVYKKSGSEYQPVVSFSDRRGKYRSAFPIALDNSGKQLLAVQADGQVVYLTGNSTVPVASFHLALQDKADELVGLVDESLAGDASTIQALVVAGDYAAAADATNLLIAQLADAAALQSASELLNLLNY